MGSKNAKNFLHIIHFHKWYGIVCMRKQDDYEFRESIFSNSWLIVVSFLSSDGRIQISELRLPKVSLKVPPISGQIMREILQKLDEIPYSVSITQLLANRKAHSNRPDRKSNTKVLYCIPDSRQDSDNPDKRYSGPAATMDNKSEKVTVNKEELRKRLTPVQYQVTQEAGTERPFTGESLLTKHAAISHYQDGTPPLEQSAFNSDSQMMECNVHRLLQQTLREGRVPVHRVPPGSVQLGDQVRLGMRMAGLQRCPRQGQGHAAPRCQHTRCVLARRPTFGQDLARHF